MFSAYTFAADLKKNEKISRHYEAYLPFDRTYDLSHEMKRRFRITRSAFSSAMTDESRFIRGWAPP